jgi:hypothetical protein
VRGLNLVGWMGGCESLVNWQVPQLKLSSILISQLALLLSEHCRCVHLLTLTAWRSGVTSNCIACHLLQRRLQSFRFVTVQFSNHASQGAYHEEVL